MTTRTSNEWYETDTLYDIMTPTGWNIFESNPKKGWHTVPISYENYVSCRDASETVKFGKNGHSSPFGDDYDSDDEDNEGGCVIM